MTVGRVSRAVQAEGSALAEGHDRERAPWYVWGEKSLVCLKTGVGGGEARLENMLMTGQVI